MERTAGIVEVTKHFKKSITCVCNWVKAGAPHDVKEEGRRYVKRFNIQELEEWLKGERNR